MQQESNPVDFRLYLRAVWRRKWLVIVPVVVAAVAGYAIARNLSPIYEARATVVMRTQERLSEPLARLVGRSPQEEQLSRLQEKIKSKAFLVELVRALDMTDDPGVQRWAERMHEKDTSLTVEELAESRMVEYLQTRVSVVRTSTSGFQVIARDFDPERAMLLAQHITNAFVTSSNREQLEQIRSIHDFSVEQLVVYKQKLDESESRLQQFQEGRMAGGRVENPINEQNVGRVDMLISQAMVEGDRAEERLTDRRQALSNMSGLDYSTLQSLSSSYTAELRDNLVELEQQVAPALIRTVGEGPELNSLYVSIAEKKDQLRDEARRIASQASPAASQQLLDVFADLKVAEVEVDMIQERRRIMAGFMWNYTQGRASAPEEEIELTRLRQEVDGNRALYEAFLEQSAAGQITEALEAARAGGRFEVIEPPMRPISPVAPDKLMILIMSVLGGFVVGLGLVLATEQGDTSFKDVEDVKATLGLSVLATVPDAEVFRAVTERERQVQRGSVPLSGGDSVLLKHMLRETPISFEFRRLIRKLKRRSGGTLPATILVTSSNRGEGKTTTAASLAISVARHNSGKTLLVDCDLRKPRVSRLMEVEPRPGLSDAIERGHVERGDIKHTSLDNLFVLPCGRRPERPSLLIERFTESPVWYELLANFDHIVIDTAPNVAVPDALLVGVNVDAVVMVVKAGVTPRAVVERGIELQQEEKDNVVGIVVNNTAHVLPYYYDYKYYGYGSTHSQKSEGDDS